MTEWLDALARRLAPSPFQPETEALIAKYASANREANRQIAELGLVVCYAVAMIPAVALFALVG